MSGSPHYSWIRSRRQKKLGIDQVSPEFYFDLVSHADVLLAHHAILPNKCLLKQAAPITFPVIWGWCPLIFASKGKGLELLVSVYIGLFQKKSTPPRRKACWKISREGGLMALEIQTWGGSEPKNTSSGVTFDFIDVSITSINKFSKNCFAFSNFIILSNYRPLTTFILSFHP